MDGGYQDKPLVEIWILPRNVKPYPNPTVDRKDVFLKNCAKRRSAKQAGVAIRRRKNREQHIAIQQLVDRSGGGASLKAKGQRQREKGFAPPGQL